jgi:microcystin-dependent protein
MAQPYVGEIRLFAGNFEPAGWMFCDGRTLPISENETLFQLIGTTYGGDGQETFQLPDLQGRIPIHQGGGFQLGEIGGVEDVTLNTNQIPAHSHPLLATNDTATQTNPGGQILSRFSQANVDPYLEQTAPNQSLAATSITVRGGSQPHTNFQPYICINYIISLFGLFPSPT